MPGAGSERESGSFGRRASLQQIRQNALIWRDVTVPKGSGGRGGGRHCWQRKRQRATSVDVADYRSQTGRSAAERRAERAAEAVGGEAKRQARNVDPGMVSVRAGAVAGERKAVACIRSRSGERLRRAIEALIRRLTKSAVGEQRGMTSSAPGCIVQCGACPR